MPTEITALPEPTPTGPATGPAAWVDQAWAWITAGADTFPGGGVALTLWFLAFLAITAAALTVVVKR